ncbi:putative histidine uptake transporter [Cytobacillus firmus]|uniref:Putative histidine uptake transporter n=1 Tax=Cytobacillus firmus TaxID=1399 RepID=A0A800N9T2_CYTFI|nr:putative histidine uptake transporter [Cytobacillus firmus]
MEKDTILSQSHQPELNPNATFKNKVKFFLFSTCPMYFIN